MLHKAGANSIFFIRAQICLRDKCIKLASRSCLGKRTVSVSRNHATLARDCKGNKQLAKKNKYQKTCRFTVEKHNEQAVQTLEAPALPCKSLILLGGNARDSNVSGLAEMLVDPNMHGASAWQKVSFIQNTLHELGFGICKTPYFSNIRSRADFSLKHSGKPRLSQKPSQPT